MLGRNRGEIDGVLSKDIVWIEENAMGECQIYFDVCQSYLQDDDGRWTRRKRGIFLPCTAYGDSAREIIKNFKKGDYVYVRYQVTSFVEKFKGSRPIFEVLEIRKYSRPKDKQPAPQDWIAAQAQGFASEAVYGKFAF